MKPRLVSAIMVAMFVVAAMRPAQAEDEIIPADLDPLAPGGIAIGMTGAEAIDALTANGFRGSGSRSFHLDRGLVSHSVSFNLGSSGVGETGDPVSEIRYSGHYFHLTPTLAQVIDRLNERLGASGNCKSANDLNARCRWDSPPGVPLVQWIGADLRTSANLKVGRGYKIELILHGVSNLEERLQSGVAPNVPSASPAPPKYWWQRDLAKAEAEPAKFIGSETYDQLSAVEQRRVRTEAEQVYDYCVKRDLFSALHDCRCVAGKFIDERLAREGRTLNKEEGPKEGVTDPSDWGVRLKVAQQRAHERLAQEEERRGAPTGLSDIVRIADDVADQCPNRPGAADYAYKKCIGQYAPRLGAEVEDFCVCYAERYTEGYMREVSANMATLTAISSAALRECTDRGHVSPLN